METLFRMETLREIIIEESKKRYNKVNYDIPQYSITDFDFNSETRTTKIVFLRKEFYRTIERYITRNYVKYPVYSAWKIKTKNLKKNIKLTNEVLELLNWNEDSLIRAFAKEIIYKTKSEALVPSWLIEECIRYEETKKVSQLMKEKEDKQKQLDKDKASAPKKIEKFKLEIRKTEKKNKKLSKKIERLTKKLNKCEKRKKSVVLSIITFFIYSYLKSQKYYKKLIEKKGISNNLLKNNLSLIETDHKEIDKINNEIAEKEKALQLREKEIVKECKLSAREANRKISLITPLPPNYREENDFVPLKAFSGLEYEKIVGCYIIKNNENEKCYVGQSKDVLRRLKQHFKGTVPNNIIFAQDYFLSKQKEDLFSVKILKLTTKDELDRKERELIDFYDARNTGYNGTNGNSD